MNPSRESEECWDDSFIQCPECGNHHDPDETCGMCALVAQYQAGRRLLGYAAIELNVWDRHFFRLLRGVPA